MGGIQRGDREWEGEEKFGRRNPFWLIHPPPCPYIECCWEREIGGKDEKGREENLWKTSELSGPNSDKVKITPDRGVTRDFPLIFCQCETFLQTWCAFVLTLVNESKAFLHARSQAVRPSIRYGKTFYLLQLVWNVLEIWYLACLFMYHLVTIKINPLFTR